MSSASSAAAAGASTSGITHPSPSSSFSSVSHNQQFPPIPGHKPTTLTNGRWRIVSAWTSLRRTFEAMSPTRPKTHDPENVLQLVQTVTTLSEPKPRPVSQPPQPSTDPNHNHKRVSLFLKRRQSAQPFATEKCCADQPSDAFSPPNNVRRVKSLGTSTPMPSNTDLSTETLEDEDKTEHAKVDNDIVGEICLEKFAEEACDEVDYDFLDGQSLDLGMEGANLTVEESDEEKGVGDGLRLIGDEREFTAFFASVGLNNLLLDDCDDAQRDEFIVDDETESEWRAAGDEHNRIFSCRSNSFSKRRITSPFDLDIRRLADHFP